MFAGRRKATMQRSITQRSAKKVSLPIVPPIHTNNLSNNDQQDVMSIDRSSPAFNSPKSSNGSCITFKGANGGSWSAMSTPLMGRNPAAALIRPHHHHDGSETPVQHRNGQRRVMKLTTVTSTMATNLNSMTNMEASGTMNQTVTAASDSTAPRHQVSAGHNNILNVVTSPRHRNSTGSNYSNTSSSSGIESVQGIHQIRRGGVGIESSGESGTGGAGIGGGTSGVCRQSVHSNSSSSGSLSSSLERLDESGYASQVNISEMINSGLPEPEVLHAWLHDLQFADYTTLFLNGGYDLATVSRMTPEDLTAIGITKPGHRKRLTMEIHRLSIQDNWPDREPPGGLNEWLTILRLSEYIELFNEEGYNSLDQVLELTWEDFEDFGIYKLGHLKKLELAIKKVKDTRSGRTKGNGRNMHEVSRNHCMTNNNNSPSPIHQSRSLAEVRTFPMMNGGGGGQQLEISSSSSEYSQPYQNYSMTNPSTPITPGSTPRPPAQSNHMSSFMMNGTMSSTNSNGHQFDTFPRRRSSHQSNSNIQMIPEGGEQHQVVTHHVTHAIVHSPSAANDCYAKPIGHHEHVFDSNNDDSPNSTSPSSSSSSAASSSSGAYSHGNIGVSNIGGGEPIYGNYDIYSDRRIELNLASPRRQSQKHVSKTTAVASPPPRPPKRPQEPHHQPHQNQNPPPKPPIITNNHQSSKPSGSLSLSIINKPHHGDHIAHPQNQQQLDNQASSDSIFGTTMSPAPSFDCLPPPVIRCEESIKNLRSMIEKKQHQKSISTTSQQDEQQQISANLPGSVTAATDATQKGVDESSGGNCVVPSSTSSVAATPSCSSTETLLFANDNCGTIKLTKNGAASTASSNSNESTTLSQHSPALTPIDPHEMDPTDDNSVPPNSVPLSRKSSNKFLKTHGPDVLNDIGTMLQNLTDELDALLVPATVTAAVSGLTEDQAIQA